MHQNGDRQQNDWDWFSEACPMLLGWKMNLSYSVHIRDIFRYVQIHPILMQVLMTVVDVRCIKMYYLEFYGSDMGGCTNF